MDTRKDYEMPLVVQVFQYITEGTICESQPNTLPGTNWDSEENEWDIWG